LSSAGVWPRRRIAELLQQEPELARRCERMVDLSAVMADDKSVRAGTRYDALRILGASEYFRCGEQLKKYLNDKDAELQMGAISGLSDMESPEAAEAILASFAEYTEENRKLAIDALQRNEERRAMLRKAMEDGRIPSAAISAEQAEKLKP
jgi:hypothetical protein